METFNEFLKSRDIQEQQVSHLWKATKPQILNYWKTLRSDSPILIKPIPYSHKGSTYGEDGIRITGSPQFIASVVGRLKDMSNYESAATKLQLVYRQTQSPSKAEIGEVKTSYVFYLAVRERGQKLIAQA
jgi:hypothetical protein